MHEEPKTKEYPFLCYSNILRMLQNGFAVQGNKHSYHMFYNLLTEKPFRLLPFINRKDHLTKKKWKAQKLLICCQSKFFSVLQIRTTSSHSKQEGKKKKK